MPGDTKIPFIYKTYHPIHSASLFGEQVFLNTLLKKEAEFRYDGDLSGLEGAVVSIRANDNVDYIDKLNSDLAKLKWCVVIVTGNENSSDFYKKVSHPNCKIWLQTPKVEDIADKFLPFGWATNIDDYIPPCDLYSWHFREFEWSFAGQITHSRREQAARVLTLLPKGQLIMTNEFNTGLAYADYIRLLSNTMVVPCPGGPATPDTFRVYEALELGCIPVVDNHSGSGSYKGNYWHKVFGDEVPFPIINDWNTFPEILEEMKSKWLNLHLEVYKWWEVEKYKLVRDLKYHIKELL